MARPCTCDDCPRCTLYHTDERYRRLWEPGAPPIRLGECKHLGGEVRRVGCGTCKGRVELKVFTCAVHGACTLRKKTGEAACCDGCKDFSPRRTLAEPSVRNLLYHVYPCKGNGVWQWNVDQLRRRIGLFNGRRVVAVVTDQRTDNLAAVRAEFKGDVHEFFELPNAPGLREVQTHNELFRRVALLDDDQATFYAHAKAVTHSRGDCKLWAEILYEVCLDRWERVRDVLRTHPVAGPLLRFIQGWSQSESEWHYSGSFFWFRNADLFEKPDWRRIDQFWSGIEPYLSLHFKKKEAGCFFHAFHKPGPGLYDMDYLQNVVLPALQQWRTEDTRRVVRA
jgi:hypothetical protein